MYRRVHTTLWSDGFFLELPNSAKYLFLYLLTGPRTNLLGLYEISLKAIARDTDLTDEQVAGGLSLLEKTGEVRYLSGWVWIKSGIERNVTNWSSKAVQKGIYNALRDLGLGCPFREEFVQFYNSTYVPQFGVQQLTIATRGTDPDDTTTQGTTGDGPGRSRTVPDGPYRSDTEADTEAEDLDAANPAASGDGEPEAKEKAKKGRPRTPSGIPAVEVYFETFKRNPSKGMYQIFDATVGRDPGQLDFWRKVLVGWRGQGWNKAHYDAQLERFKKRSIPGENPAKGRRQEDGARRHTSQAVAGAGQGQNAAELWDSAAPSE